MKLSFKLPLLIIISAAIVAAAVGVMQFLTVQASIINTENEANMNSVSAYASSVGFYLDQAQDIMEITASEVEAALSSNLSTSGQSEEELHQSVHNIASAVQENSKVFEYIIFLNTDGTVRVIEPDDLLQGMARKDLGYTDWYKKLIGNGQTVISNLRISPTTQRPTVVIAVPVHGPDAKIIGIVAGGLNLGQLSQIGTMGQQAGQPLRYGLITDGKGLIIADQANPKNVLEQTDFSSALPVQAALSGKTGTMRFVSLIDGIDKLAAYMPLAGTGWAAEYWVPVQVAFEPLYRLSAYMTGLAVLMIILMGIGSLLITRQVTDPLRNLATATEKIGGGDLSHRIKVTGNDELSQLGNEFNRMAVSLQATTLERDRSEGEKLKAEALVSASRVAKNMIDGMSDPVVLAGPDGRIVDFNQATTDLWGYGDELIGTMPTRLVLESEAATVFGVIKDAMEKGYAKNVQHTALTKDGREVPILLSVVMLRDIEGNPMNIVAVIRDISELKAKELEYQTILRTATDGFWLTDMQGHFLNVNQSYCDLTGYSYDELMKMAIPDIEVIEKPEDVAKRIKKITEVGSDRFETRHRHKDGRILEVEVSVNYLPVDNGRMCVFTRDITERKKAEMALAEKTWQLERSNAELQSFAYVASHDLQEPLRTISSYMQLLEKRYKPKLDKDAQEFIDFAVSGSIRLQNMIGGLLEFSRVETRGEPFEWLSCESVLEHVTKYLKKAIDESKAEITHDPLPRVLADRSQLTSLFQNLVANSIRYHGNEPPRIHVSATKQDGDYVFAVSDNGIGIDPEYKEQIFVIFQRLHGRNVPGIGLGLAVARKIVERHGGRIWVESKPGNGATFYFTIPIEGGNQ